MKNFCTKCGNQLGEGKDFCNKCGTKFNLMPSTAPQTVAPQTTAQQGINMANPSARPTRAPGACPECGNVNSPTSQFCSKCGMSFGVQAHAPVHAHQPAVPYAQMQQPVGKEKSNLFKAVAIGGAAVVVLVLVGFFAMNFFGGDGAQDTDDVTLTAPDLSAEQPSGTDDQTVAIEPPVTEPPPEEEVAPPVDEPSLAHDIDPRLFGVWEYVGYDEEILFILNDDLTAVIVEVGWASWGEWADAFEVYWTVSDNELVLIYDGEEGRLDLKIIDGNTIEIEGEWFHRIETTEIAGFDLHGTWDIGDDEVMLVFDPNGSGRLYERDWDDLHFRWFVSHNFLVIVEDEWAMGETFSVIDANTVSLFGDTFFRR